MPSWCQCQLSLSFGMCPSSCPPCWTVDRVKAVLAWTESHPLTPTPKLLVNPSSANWYAASSSAKCTGCTSPSGKPIYRTRSVEDAARQRRWSASMDTEPERTSNGPSLCCTERWWCHWRIGAVVVLPSDCSIRRSTKHAGAWCKRWRWWARGWVGMWRVHGRDRCSFWVAWGGEDIGGIAIHCSYRIVSPHSIRIACRKSYHLDQGQATCAVRSRGEGRQSRAPGVQDGIQLHQHYIRIKDAAHLLFHNRHISDYRDAKAYVVTHKGCRRPIGGLWMRDVVRV